MRGWLSGTVVVVTGAGRGIGREVALLAAREGARVVVNDLGGAPDGDGADAAPADAVVAEIAAQGGTAVANVDDVADESGARRIVGTALEAFGQIDAVVNNAGILRDRIFHEMAPVDFEKVLRVHLLGAFNVSRAAAEHFRRQERGAFVHMTSTSGLIGNLGQANYAAAKLGIVGLSRSIALDMARYGVRSNCVAPFAWTRLFETVPASNRDAERLDRMKLLEAAQVAPLVAYLASDRASAVTGQIFAVRGNDVFLFSQPRPVRSLHHDGGWTVEALDEAIGVSFATSYTPLERSTDIFDGDPR